MHAYRSLPPQLGAFWPGPLLFLGFLVTEAWWYYLLSFYNLRPSFLGGLYSSRRDCTFRKRYIVLKVSHEGHATKTQPTNLSPTFKHYSGVSLVKLLESETSVLFHTGISKNETYPPFHEGSVGREGVGWGWERVAASNDHSTLGNWRVDGARHGASVEANWLAWHGHSRARLGGGWKRLVCQTGPPRLQRCPSLASCSPDTLLIHNVHCPRSRPLRPTAGRNPLPFRPGNTCFPRRISFVFGT